jgi:hypothetical protein
MMTKVALLGDTFLVVKVNGIIGANLDTCLATRTRLIIHNHDTIGSFANRLFGTGANAGRFIAVSAQIDLENKIELSVDHPGLTEMSLTPSAARFSCLQATSQVLHPQQAS